MNILDKAVHTSFLFQQYRALDESRILPYEALAILKNADGARLPNADFFDELRSMAPEMQVTVDKFLVPLAIRTAAAKKRLPVAVNVHVATLCDDEFLASIEDVIDKARMDRKDVMFEIVEPHVPTSEQVEKLQNISARLNPGKGFVLIVDDHDFKSGEDRLRLLAPLCDMVKINLDQAEKGVATLKIDYPHMAIVLERVTFNERDKTFARYPGVAVQGL